MKKRTTKTPPEVINRDIRVICTVGHQVPLGAGRFKVYDRGKEYTLSDYDPAFFTPAQPKEEVLDDASE